MRTVLLMPAADFARSESAFHATFVLTNVVAQRLSVNAGRWRQSENAMGYSRSWLTS